MSLTFLRAGSAPARSFGDHNCSIVRLARYNYLPSQCTLTYLVVAKLMFLTSLKWDYGWGWGFIYFPIFQFSVRYLKQQFTSTNNVVTEWLCAKHPPANIDYRTINEMKLGMNRHPVVDIGIVCYNETLQNHLYANRIKVYGWPRLGANVTLLSSL